MGHPGPVTTRVIVVVAGVSGSGKSTIGALLAAGMHTAGEPADMHTAGMSTADMRTAGEPAEFADGDAFHPAANVAKMRAGIPLDDADRRPWLDAIEGWMDERIAAGRPAVMACSALRRAYRAELLGGRPTARMVFLRITRELAAARLAARPGHFFPPALLDSQFGDLEPPDPAEHVLVVDAGPPAATLADTIAARLGLPGWRSVAGEPGPARPEAAR